MENRNGRSSFLTFLTALIPGVGYMYLGLVKKGIQILALYLLIEPVFSILGIGFLSAIVKIPIWFYTFFDTFTVANKIDRGEPVPDMDLIFNKYMKNGSQVVLDREKLGKNFSLIVAIGLIVVGGIAILHNFSIGSPLYGLIRSFVSTYFIPVLFVLGGIYLLFKNKA
jgi:TM2 domain-containing membrane protein YozV